MEWEADPEVLYLKNDWKICNAEEVIKKCKIFGSQIGIGNQYGNSNAVENLLK